MSTEKLNQAIQFIQQGQDAQAQAILQEIIRTNHQDLIAWSWYVKSFHTPKKRIQALELSLKFNPGNTQMIDAIRKLRGKLLDESEPTLEHIYVSDDMLVSDMPSPHALTVIPDDFSKLVVESEPIKIIQVEEVQERVFLWYDVWWLAVKNPSENIYHALLQDPLASVGRAYGWMFLAALITEVTFMLALYLDPRYKILFMFIESIQNEKNGGAILVLSTLVILMVGAGLGVLTNILTAAIYNILAKSLGGKSEDGFARTFYLMAAYSAPVSIVIGILSMIPCINLIALGLRFYSFRFNVLTIQTVYRLNGLRAALVIAFPALVILFLSCLLGILFVMLIFNPANRDSFRMP